MGLLLFNVAGIASVTTLALIALLLMRAPATGDTGVIARFFEAYPGSEPFVIFMFPVVLIAGPAWVWYRGTRRRRMKGGAP